jgi:L-alanine-DL-glutamate epimerase-like enolase superfamily enzyme
MARIEKVELRMVDLVPKVKRTDAIQSFVSQETPIVTITDSDGATGTGYSYTIGTGGSSVMRLIADHLAPRLIGRDADMIEAIWHELEFATHATTIGAITAIALAAIDTALWDLRARKQGLPLWKLAGGAKEKCPLYTTEGGWLHIETEALVDDAVEAKAKGFLGSKVKIGRPHGSEDHARLSAVRAAVGDGYEIMTDCNQGFSQSMRRSGAPTGCANWISPGSRSRFRPMTSTVTSASPARPPRRSQWENRSTRSAISANICRRAAARSSRSMSGASAASPPG